MIKAAVFSSASCLILPFIFFGSSFVFIENHSAAEAQGIVGGIVLALLLSLYPAIVFPVVTNLLGNISDIKTWLVTNTGLLVIILIILTTAYYFYTQVKPSINSVLEIFFSLILGGMVLLSLPAYVWWQTMKNAHNKALQSDAAEPRR